MKYLLNTKRINVRQIHEARIEVSAYSDHERFLLMTRSTIVQTTIPEKDIIPDSSQI
jgi:hypothetical protein